MLECVDVEVEWNDGGDQVCIRIAQPSWDLRSSEVGFMTVTARIC